VLNDLAAFETHDVDDVDLHRPSRDILAREGRLAAGRLAELTA